LSIISEHPKKDLALIGDRFLKNVQIGRKLAKKLPQTINVVEVWQKLQLHGFCENILVSIFEVIRMKEFDTPKKIVIKTNFRYCAMYSFRINPLNQRIEIQMGQKPFYHLSILTWNLLLF
jgi:hypothetical protein